jgi:hypothetical protein
VGLPTVSPEIAKAAAAMFHAVADHIQSGKPIPAYLVTLLSEVAIAVGAFLVVKKGKDKDE